MLPMLCTWKKSSLGSQMDVLYSNYKECLVSFFPFLPGNICVTVKKVLFLMHLDACNLNGSLTCESGLVGIC